MAEPITTATAKISMFKTFLYLPLISAIGIICEYLYLTPELLKLLLAMMLIDFITAGYKSVQLSIAFSFRSFFEGVFGKIIRFVLLFAVGIMVASAKVVQPDIVSSFSLDVFLQWVTIFLIVVELVSAWDNVIAAKEKKMSCEFDLFTWGLKFSRHKIISKVIALLVGNKKV